MGEIFCDKCGNKTERWNHGYLRYDKEKWDKAWCKQCIDQSHDFVLRLPRRW